MKRLLIILALGLLSVGFGVANAQEQDAASKSNPELRIASQPGGSLSEFRRKVFVLLHSLFIVSSYND